MYQLLYKYFLLNRRVCIPGVGVFAMQNTPARIDFVTGILHAPQPKVLFSHNEQPAEDKSLVQYLSKEMKVEEWKAVEAFKEFTSSITGSINESQPVTLPGIGQLHKNSASDEVFFTEETAATRLFLNDIKLSTATDSKANLVELYSTGDTLILTEETEDDKLEMIIKEKDEDYWWVYALILALMGVGALLYYYI